VIAEVAVPQIVVDAYEAGADSRVDDIRPDVQLADGAT
jgi:hypothetical protein